MISSIREAVEILNNQRYGIPFDAIKYLQNEPTSPQIIQEIVSVLLHAYDDYYYNEKDNFLMPAPLWFAIIAESHLSEELIDPVIKLFTVTNKDWDLLNEQGMFLIGRLAQKYPDLVMEKVTAAIDRMIKENSDYPYLFLFDAFYFADLQKYKSWFLETLQKTNLYWQDNFAQIVSDLEIKEAIPIIKKFLLKEKDHARIIEFKECLKKLENGLDEEYARYARPYFETRSEWEDHYKSFERHFSKEYQEEREDDEDNENDDKDLDEVILDDEGYVRASGLFANPELLKKAQKALGSNKRQSFESKLKDGGKCVCDICGRTAKMGGMLDPQSGNPRVACYDCMMEMSAREHGIDVAEAKQRRDKMFKALNLFTQQKIDEYYKSAGENAKGGLDETNEVVKYIMNVWNTFDKSVIDEFEKKDEEELKKAYSGIKMNYSGFIKQGKVGRNDPCPCGSGKKYKKCCLIHDELEERLVSEWKEVDSLVIKKGMRIIDTIGLDTKLLVEHFWGEKRLDRIRDAGAKEVDEYEFNEWLMNDYYAPNSDVPLILGKLLEDQTLTNNERTLVEARIKAPKTVWMITFIQKGMGVYLRNIFDYEEKYVHDIQFSNTANEGYLVCCRILEVGAYILISGAYMGYPTHFRKEIKDVINNEYNKYGSKENINSFLRHHGYVFGRMESLLKGINPC